MMPGLLLPLGNTQRSLQLIEAAAAECGRQKNSAACQEENI